MIKKYTDNDDKPILETGTLICDLREIEDLATKIKVFCKPK